MQGYGKTGKMREDKTAPPTGGKMMMQKPMAGHGALMARMVRKPRGFLGAAKA